MKEAQNRAKKPKKMAAIPLMYAQEDCELGGKESIEVRIDFMSILFVLNYHMNRKY